MAPDPSLISLRANDNQRETVTQTLNQMYRQGYLPLDEYERRTNAALHSINQAQLRYLLRDLPDTPDTQTLFHDKTSPAAILQPTTPAPTPTSIQTAEEDGMATSSGSKWDSFFNVAIVLAVIGVLAALVSSISLRTNYEKTNLHARQNVTRVFADDMEVMTSNAWNPLTITQLARRINRLERDNVTRSPITIKAVNNEKDIPRGTVGLLPGQRPRQVQIISRSNTGDIYRKTVNNSNN